ncbi:LysE family translocator [Corynebacterium sp. YIM 101645]|uniref:LysE family translocator n=1 Tax=Corynebacterium lemuris TaxID=1859292 RepID=A0ABT2FY78_9CORY|nr:LysE family translocator [Corynebacterium lemuris]MCS5480192.1 LysE family translocator [Corynebacterium lemuris]
MSLAQWATLLFLNIAGAASPGPDILLITRTAIRSRRHALATVLGIQVGVLFWCTLTVLGFAALLNAFPALLGFLQLVGGVWLVWMGRNMLRVGLRERKDPPLDIREAASRLGRLRHSFRLGLATNLSNPKIVLFLSALIAPLLPASPSVLLAVGVVVLLSVSSVILQLGIAMMVSTPGMRRRFLSAGPWIDIVAGVFFLVAGAVLAYNGLADLFG